MKHYTLDGSAVAALREANGLRLADVADKAGISVPYLSMLEDGRRQPSSAVALKIANALGARFADIAATKGLDSQGRCDHCGYHVDSPGYKTAHEIAQAS